MAHDIFISHSNSDNEKVELIRQGLENRGIRCWVDYRDIPPDRDWPKEIMSAIKDCTVLLIVLSQSSNKSEQVAREAENADRAHKKILTIRLDNVSPDGELAYWVGKKNWFDARSDLEQTVGRLADRVRAILLEREAEEVFGRSEDDDRGRVTAATTRGEEGGLGRFGSFILRVFVRSLRLQSRLWGAVSGFLWPRRKRVACWVGAALLVLFLYGRVFVYPHSTKATYCLAEAVHGSKLKERVRFNYLLFVGTNPDPRGDLSVSPLVTAASDGNLRALRWLIRCGADVEQTGSRCNDGTFSSSTDSDSGDPTPLLAAMTAPESKRVAVVQALLAAGANVNGTRKDGTTALHLAEDTDSGSSDKDDEAPMAKLLLEAKASVGALDDDGDTPLHRAAARGDAATVAMLLEAQAPVAAANKEGDTPLHEAVANGDTDLVKLLLDANAPANAVNKNGITPLHVAAFSSGNSSYSSSSPEELVKMLLARGAKHSLFTAAYMGDPMAVRRLLASGAVVNATLSEASDYTPLSAAIEEKNWGVAKLLLGAGARGNVEASRGYEKVSALVAAISSGDIGLIKLLLARGASLRSGDPLGRALSSNQLQIADFLRAKGATTAASD